MHEIDLSYNMWLHCFDTVIFTLLDELLEMSIGQCHKNYRIMDITLMLAMKLLTEVFLRSIDEVMKSASFSKIWMDVLIPMEDYMKVKIKGRRSDRLKELVPELLKNTLLVMKSRGVITQESASVGESLWELAWSLVIVVNNFMLSLQYKVVPEACTDQSSHKQDIDGAGQAAPLAVLAPIQTVASES